MIAEGHYRARALSWGWEPTRAGDPSFVIEWEIVAGSFEGERILSRLYFHSEKAAPIAIRQLRALGWQGQDLGALDTADLDARVIALRVAHEEYQGKTQLRVSIAEPWRPRTRVGPERLASLTKKCVRLLAESTPTDTTAAPSDGVDDFS